MKMIPHMTILDEDDGRHVMIHPASEWAISHVLAQAEDSSDGRSQFVWIRLPNGDLILGVFPQGDTYFDVELDAQYQGDYHGDPHCV